MGIKTALRLLLLLPCALWALRGYSQRIDQEKLNAYFDALSRHDRYMGSIAVSKGDSLIFRRTLGYADRQGGQQATPASRYRIGSISKIFTAVLVLKAIEQGKIKLTDPIKSFFPQIPRAADISIADLLQHRSGIHNFTEHPMYMAWYTLPKSRQEMLKIIAAGGSDFPPGSKAGYSNSNYLLLSYLLEDIFKQPYATSLRTYITGPLGLKDTYLGESVDRDKNEVYSYKYLSGWVRDAQTHSSVSFGAGALVSTPSDLTRFIHALFSGRLLKAESLKKMKTLKDDIGLGLFAFRFQGHTALGHTGGVDGFRSVVGYFEKDSIAYALCSNGSRRDPGEVRGSVLSAIFNLPFQVPDFKPLEVDSARLDLYTGVYASAELPLELRIYREGARLYAQGSGQPAFEIEARGQDRFEAYALGIAIDFHPGSGTLKLHQAGRTFQFKRRSR